MPLSSHLKFCHMVWQLAIKPGDCVVDATLGNGHDALALAKMLKGEGTLIGYDVQREALANSKKLLKNETITLELHQQCHSNLEAENPKLIVYNLGYLPGSDKVITTQLETTLLSIKRAQKIVADEGLISITLYPGHKEGLEEQEALLAYAETLDKRQWHVSLTSWPNRKKGPSVLLLQKKSMPPPS